MNEPLTVTLLVAGIGLLAVSLAARHNDAPNLASISSWAGAILVVVGVGKMLFLDGKR